MHQSLLPVSGKLCKSSWVSWTADEDRVVRSVTTHADLCRVTSCPLMRTFFVSQKFISANGDGEGGEFPAFGETEMMEE